LVVTLGNWARPRDLAHFEQFRHYHETFYAQLEPPSVTPFSATSLDRGLDGLLVSAARVTQATRTDGLSAERNAGLVEKEHGFITALVDTLLARVARASDELSTNLARQQMANRLDHWLKRRTYLLGMYKNLVYERLSDDAHFGPLMNSPENARLITDSKDAPPFVVANSMREVQPQINLLVSPIKENLVFVPPRDAPTWAFPAEDAE